MQIITEPKDIFALPEGPNEAICVTTNGIIKRNGHAVMGRGIALTANQRFNLSLQLAGYLTKFGNRAFHMGVKKDALTGRQMRVITFPTKHDWKDKSDIELIKTSAHQVAAICNKFNIKTCYLTKPGCSNGGLNWERQVRPVLEEILDDRFIVVDEN